MLSDVLILDMWQEWVHKHLQEVAKSVVSWGKFSMGFLILLTGKFYTDFEYDDFNKLHW